MGKRRRRGKKKFTIPLAPIAGLLAAPAISAGIHRALEGDMYGVAFEAQKFLGVSGGKFNAAYLIENISPIIIGCLVHKFVGGAPLNLNKMLASAGVPFVRI